MRHRAATPVFVGGLTLIALALRIRGMREGLYQDELISFHEISGRSFGSMLHAVAHGAGHGSPVENTPPLWFILAWLSAKLGSDTVWMRLPSVVASTLTVPLVYVIGRRTLGRPAGLVAAAIMALSTFAIFYGTEARAYALLAAVGALSCLLLLRAVQAPTPRSWLWYGVSVAALLYTQYIGVVLLAMQAAWVVLLEHRRLRGFALALAGAAVAFIPWVPEIHTTPADFGALAQLMGFNHFDALRQWVIGSPDVAPKAVPGHAALLLLAVSLALGLIALAWSRPRVSRAAVLVVGLAAVTPIASLAYSWFGTDLFAYPRNMIGSLPFVALVIGGVVTTAAAALVAVPLLLAALALGAVAGQRRAYGRPNFPGAARAIERTLRPGELVVYYGGGLDPFILSNHLTPYLRIVNPAAGATPEVPDSLGRALAKARGNDAVVLGFRLRARPLPFPTSAGGWRLRTRRDFDGTSKITVATYRRRSTS